MGRDKKPLQLNKPYYEICREERNLAAILYHLLLHDGNLKIFLEKLLDEKPSLSPFTKEEIENNYANMAVYFEFAFPRDLWAKIKRKDKEEADKIREKAIREYIGDSIAIEEDVGIKKFNKHFVKKRASTKQIQSPATWNDSKLAELAKGDKLRDILKFKWAFRVKPDIVIIYKDTKKNTGTKAICIEAKCESGEGYYRVPGNKKEQKEEEIVRQTTIQRYLMEKLLGFETQFVFLSKNKKSNPPKGYLSLSWPEVFGWFKSSEGSKLTFLSKWIDRLCNSSAGAKSPLSSSKSI